MTWTVAWTSAALGDLRRQDRRLTERIIAAVERLAETGHGDVKRLRGSEEYRLRVGQWRVRFALEAEEAKLLVLRVLPRGSAYR